MRRCLLVCEGPFDELIFSILKEVFDESLFEIKPLCRCCVDTPDLKNNAESLVGEILSKEKGYKREDFDEICFLIDSDGIYVSDDQIIENEGLSSTKYKSSSIECPDKKSIVTRNNIRKANISDLLSGRNYWIFYNSRNLEHAFDSSLSGSLRDSTKKRFALDTMTIYSEDIEAFIRKLKSMNKSNTSNIFKSWDYIKAGCNSLSSTSNMFIFLIMHFYALKDKYKDLVKELLRD